MSPSPEPDLSNEAEIRTGEDGPDATFALSRIRGERERLHRDTEWLDHAHSAHELMWCQEGAMTLATGQMIWTIAGRQGLWLPAGTSHSGRIPAGATYQAVFFEAEHVPPLSPGPVTVTITPLLGQLLDYIPATGLSKEKRERAEAVVMDLLEPVTQELVLEVPTHSLIAPAASEILANPSGPHSVEEWSQRLHISSRTLTRTFRSEAGVGFARWVAMARARYAIELLADGLGVAETAKEVGYASTSAFGVAFRRVTGVTPGAFRHD